MSEDVREINKVSEHVLSLLEAPVSSDKIVDALEKRRAKAIARTLGLSSINNLMSLSFRRETGLIRSFVESLKTNNVKGHYWEGIEGIDPNLLRCVQKSFYSIYNLLQRELVKSKGAAFDKVSISHYLVVLDALSFPFKEADNHLILEQQFPIIINILLNWSKGHIGEELESKSFLKDGVITSLQIIEEENILDEVEKILLETKEGGQSLYLVISRGGTSYPLTDFQVTGDNVEGCEKVGQFERDGETKGIYIKRREPNPGNQYLVTLNESFSTEYKPYFELLGDESEEDKKNRTALKERLCRSAWAAYKLLVFTTAGSISINESNIKSQVQNLFLHSIFSELKYDETLLELGYSGLDLKSIVNADLWLNKMTISKDQAKNPTQEWIRQFNKETENIEDSLLNEMIQDLITRADPAMKGVLSSDEINKLDPDVAVLVSSDTYKNYKGEFDFFRYIASLANMKSTYSNDVQSYLSESPL